MARILNVFCCCLSFDQLCFNKSSPFSVMDIFLTFLSVGSFLGDIATDIIVIIQYYKNGHFTWMLLTTSLVCVPSLVIQIFSIRWYIIDGTVSSFLWLAHVFQLGVFHRYLKLLSLGFKIRKDCSSIDLKRFNQQQSDICMLRLFESFMESAPQLVLQLYIMISTDEWNPWTGISAIASILSLSWGIAAYSKAMRNVRPEKKPLSWWGLLFQSLWRIGMVSSRIFSMVLFAAGYGFWLILAMAFHWLSMTIWVFFQDTDFCTTWWEERLYNAVVGIVYCFCYFNIKEGQSRYRMTVYYSLVISQNISFLLAFYYAEKTVEGIKYFMIFLVPSGIIIGIISLLLYYRFFHPSGPIECFQSKPLIKAIASDIKDYSCNCCTLKTCRKLREDRNEFIRDGATEHVESVENSPKNLNISKTSVKYVGDSKKFLSRGLPKSYSFNCSWRTDELNQTNSSYCTVLKRTSLANHHTNINYHFRPAANSTLSSSNIHCSCLVLSKDTNRNIKDISMLQKTKISASLPNIEIGNDLNSFLMRNASLMNYFSDLSHSNTSSISEGNLSFIRNTEHGPIIHDDHIIRISI